MARTPGLKGIRTFVVQVLVAVVGCLGVAWGFSNFARSIAADEFRNLESHVLRFETFSPSMTTKLLESPATGQLSACSNHSQRALLLLEIPLAQKALQSGDVGAFDRHLQSLDTRSREVLTCVPRDPLAWLVLFGIEILHGRLDQHSFDLLAASYETSPSEAWIALRRTIIAIPVVLSAPTPVREKILAEFEQLVRHGFPEIPARAYLVASSQIRALLDSRIGRLEPSQRSAFSEALQRVRI